MPAIPPLPDSDSEELTSPEPSPQREPTRTRHRSIAESKIDIEDLTSSPESDDPSDQSMDEEHPEDTTDPGSPARLMDVSDTKGSEKRSRDSNSPPKETKRGKAQKPPPSSSSKQTARVINLDDIQGLPLQKNPASPESANTFTGDSQSNQDPEEQRPEQAQFLRHIQTLINKETTSPEPVMITITRPKQHKSTKTVKQLLTQLSADQTDLATVPYKNPNSANDAHHQIFALIRKIVLQSHDIETMSPSDIPLAVLSFVIQRLLRNQFDFSNDEDLLSPKEAEALRTGVCRFAHSNPFKIFTVASYNTDI